MQSGTDFSFYQPFQTQEKQKDQAEQKPRLIEKRTQNLDFLLPY
jgi:hypothetical protein